MYCTMHCILERHASVNHNGFITYSPGRSSGLVRKAHASPSGVYVYGKSRLSSISLSASMTLPSPTSATLGSFCFIWNKTLVGISGCVVSMMSGQCDCQASSGSWACRSKIQTMIWLIETSYIAHIGSNVAVHANVSASAQRHEKCGDSKSLIFSTHVPYMWYIFDASWNRGERFSLPWLTCMAAAGRFS